MSALAAQPGRIGSRALAIVTALLVALSGLLIVPAAHAADGPTITVTPAENLDPAVDNVLTVTGTGFIGDAAASGIYLVFGDKSIWAGGGPLVANGWLALDWVTADSITDGSFERQIKVPAGKLDPAVGYHVGTSAAHGLSATERSLDAFFPVTVAQPVVAPTQTATALSVSAETVAAGESVTLTAGVTPSEAAGTVTFTDNGAQIGEPQAVAAGVASIVAPALPEGTHTFGAVFTPADEAAFAGSQASNIAVEVAAEPESMTPEVAVFAADGKTELSESSKLYAGDKVVVKGSGFDPNKNTGARPPLAGKKTGVYVAFGNFGKQWRPSEGHDASKRVVADQKWAMPQDSIDNPNFPWSEANRKQLVLLGEDGSFEAELTVGDADATPGSYGVFTYVAGGATADVAQELEQRLNYVGKRAPEVAVFAADGKTELSESSKLYAGDKVVVKGSGFDPNKNTGARPPLAGKKTGVYVAFGNFGKQWRPSEGHDASKRVVADQKWAMPQDSIDNPNFPWSEANRKQLVLLGEDGSFEAELTVGDADATPGSYGVFTYVAGGATADVAQELEQRLNYVGKQTPDPDPKPEVPVGGLDWAFNTGWNSYVRFVAGGSITGSNGAKTDAAGLTNYTQVKGGNYDPKTSVGTIHYQGTVRYQSNNHGFDIAIKDPRITFTSATAAELSAEISTSDESGVGSMSRVVLATVKPGKGVVANDGLRSWADATGVFGKLTFPEGWVDYSGKVTAPLSFSHGSDNIEVPVDPEGPGTTPGKPKPQPQPQPKPKPIGKSNAQQAGSLSWGISSGFKGYVTGRIAKGSISTSGVGANGGAYLFPQAAGGSWNAQSQTGTVQFSGVVTFTGHKGLLSESFANPVLTVNSPTSGTISAGGRSFGLDLGAASKSVGANGEVTWSGVPVSGSISGGGSTGAGAAGSGSFGADPLSFTVGVPSSVQYGSTTQSEQKAERESAASAPTTEGIRVITPKEDIVPGGQIEFVAPGFESNERDVLVVLYSDPVVLDKKAGANEFGEVRWIGTIPEDTEPGEHTITLQGSTDAGAKITVVDPDKKKTKKQDKPVVKKQTPESATTQSAALLPESGDGPVWLWWVGAGGLLVLAAALTGLVVSQRRAAANANVDAGSGS